MSESKGFVPSEERRMDRADDVEAENERERSVMSVVIFGPDFLNKEVNPSVLKVKIEEEELKVYLRPIQIVDGEFTHNVSLSINLGGFGFCWVQFQEIHLDPSIFNSERISLPKEIKIRIVCNENGKEKVASLSFQDLLTKGNFANPEIVTISLIAQFDSEIFDPETFSDSIEETQNKPTITFSIQQVD
jgi:hypothetical protein